MIDWLIASAVIILACTLVDIPLWFSLLMIVLSSVGGYVVGDE